jgi:UPF0755 protein
MGKKAALLCGALLMLFLSYVGVQLFIPTGLGDRAVEVQIPEGATFKQALVILAQNRLMRDVNPFLIIGRIQGTDRKVRAGFYSFLGSMTPYEVFRRLLAGKVIEYEVTITEGESLEEIGDRLSAAGVLGKEAFSTLTRDRGLLEALDVHAPSLEGYLFPQTYRIPKGTSPETVLRHMVKMLRDTYDDCLRERGRQIGWDENRVLTLASIIEKEAVVDSERPLISAVYHNRLEKGMPLQADPTAIYGVKSPGSRITRRDLTVETRYNTYIIKGLPPGPISSPGIKSIQAALYPADVPYLYFVSKGDGTHHFSTTLTQHNAAIRSIRSQGAKTSREEPPPSLPQPEETGDKEG